MPSTILTNNFLCAPYAKKTSQCIVVLIFPINTYKYINKIIVCAFAIYPFNRNSIFNTRILCHLFPFLPIGNVSIFFFYF